MEFKHVSIAASRAGSSDEALAGYPAGDPTVAWKGTELDAYAAAHGLEISKAKTKQDKVDAMADQRAETPEAQPTPSNGQDEPADTPQTPADPAANTNPSGGEPAQKPEEG